LHFLNFKKKQIVEKSIQANENKSKCKHEKAWKTELNRMHNDNRERIFKKNEGIQKSEQEFDLIKEFLETKKKIIKLFFMNGLLNMDNHIKDKEIW